MTQWARTSDMLPPIGIRVRVKWQARVFECAYVRHPKTRDAAWLTQDDYGQPVFLPGKWGLKNEPELWQPLDIKTW